MVQALLRYKIVIFILSLLILIGAIWAIYLGQHTKKIPMRGVFVFEQCDGISIEYDNFA